MPQSCRIFLVAMFLGLSSLAIAAGKKDDAARYVTSSVTISGAVANPLKLSVAELKKFPSETVGEMPVVCQTGATTSTVESLKGVRLRDVLENAGIVAPQHNDVKKMVIIASATDGYKVVFTWSELFNSPLGEGVLVFFEKNGQPLGEEEGSIALISAKDIRTGPRHVKWLSGIEVRKIVD